MGKKDRRIDEYIAKSAEFAKPILSRLRKLAHEGCPGLEETMKWSFPHFVYKSEILASMAGFKQHCTFGFWKASLMRDPEKIILPTGDTSMGQFGKIRSLEDLPSEKVLLAYIREAAKLNEAGIKAPKKPKASGNKELIIPGYLLEALDLDKAAKATFDNFSYSQKKEYVEWLMDAKTEATRERRLATALEWMAEGKTRNWKYAKC